jgi:hypothetical protein
MADGFETKRSSAVPVPVRPADTAPPSSAALEEREDWSERFVWWFLSETGGDPDVEGVPTGHRWRIEYFDCVRDPQAFERYAEQAIAAYSAKGGV